MPRRPNNSTVLLTVAVVFVLACTLATAVTSCSRPWVLIDTARTKLPSAVTTWLDSYKNIQVGTSFTHETYTYLLASWGIKDTGSYQVKITGVDISGPEVIVRTEWTHAAPFAAVEPHYPHALARIRRNDKPVRFDATEWTPSLVGVPAALLIKGPSLETIYSHPKTDSVEFGSIFVGTSGLQPVAGEIVVEGIARVFEGTVEYDFAGEDGQTFGHGFVTAQSGGPDWGYFVISVPEPTPLPRYLRIYSTSAEDGRMQDLVMVDLFVLSKAK